MSFNALRRFVLATEDEAIAWRSPGFSFSRLNGLGWSLLLVLSDFGFESFEAGKLEPDERPAEVEAEDGLIGWRADNAGVSDSPLPKGSSAAPRSVSWRTLDASRRAGFFRWGNCLYKAAICSMPGVDWYATAHCLNRTEHFCFTSTSDKESVAATRRRSSNASSANARWKRGPAFSISPSRTVRARSCL